jgi:N-acetylglucosaminyl-diphospho-decaprenol L-rhamnosyltransferase
VTGPERPWVVVVTWNGAARLAETLGALREADRELDLVVVDNGSTDGSAELAGAVFPGVHLIRNPENRGFACGSNQGIEHALARGASHVALVNDDMRLDRAWLRELLAESARDPSIGVLGGLILFADRPDTINSSGLVRDRWWRVRDRDFGAPRSARCDLEASDVAGVSGGAMLLTRSALEQVGRLDPTLFAYFEDFDFCVRARRAGFRVRFVPAAVSWHAFAASTGPGSPLRAHLIARNHMAMVGRYAPAPQVVPELVGIALVRALVRAPLALARGRPGEADAEVRGSLAGLARGLAELGARLRRSG